MQKKDLVEKERHYEVDETVVNPIIEEVINHYKSIRTSTILLLANEENTIQDRIIVVFTDSL